MYSLIKSLIELSSKPPSTNKVIRKMLLMNKNKLLNRIVNQIKINKKKKKNQQIKSKVDSKQ